MPPTQYNKFVREFAQQQPGPQLFQRAGAAWRQMGGKSGQEEQVVRNPQLRLNIPPFVPVVYVRLLRAPEEDYENNELIQNIAQEALDDVGIVGAVDIQLRADGMDTLYKVTIRSSEPPGDLDNILDESLAEAGFVVRKY